MRNSRRLIAFVLLARAVSLGQTSAAPSYTMIGLGTLGEGGSVAYAINDSGQIVGGGEWDAPLSWTNSSPPISLGTLGGEHSAAYAINNSGQIVGCCTLGSDYVYHAAFWADSSSAPIDLGTLGGVGCIAGAINNSGQIVGWTDDYWHAVFWADSSSAPIDLNSLIAPDSGWGLHCAAGINDAGEIVGYGDDPSEEVHAFLLKPGTVKLIPLEVTQVIQDWDNSVPLVAGKTTYVRAFLEPNDPNVPYVALDLDQVQLVGPNGDVVTPINDRPFFLYQNAATQRGVFSSSVNFQLPPEWTTTGNPIQLTLKSNDPNVPSFNCLEPGETGADPDGCNVTNLTFENTAMPWIEFVRVTWFDPITGEMYQTSDAEVEEVINRVKAIFPVADSWGLGNGASQSQLVWTGPVPLNNNGTVSSDFLKTVDDELAEMQKSANNTNALYYGILVGKPLGGRGNKIGGTVACGSMYNPNFDPENLGRNCAAHELGHLLGLPHDVNSGFPICTTKHAECNGVYTSILNTGGGACNDGDACYIVACQSVTDFPDFYPAPPDPDAKPCLGPMNGPPETMIYGMDQSFGPWPTVIDPTVHYDLMGYCGPLWTWVSDYTYSNLWAALEGLASRTDAATTCQMLAPPKANDQGSLQDYLLVRGTIDMVSDVTSFLPFGRVSSATAPALPAVGDYTLQLLDAGSNAVGQVSFQPDVGETTEFFPATDSTSASFLIPVLADPAIRQAVILHGGTILATLTGSSNAPQVSLVFPNCGETLQQDPLTLQWSGSDAGGVALTFDVLYSADGGVSWQTLAVDWTNQTYTIDNSFLAATTNGLIRVIASDGFNTVAAQSAGPFTVPNHAPSVSILAPTEGQVFTGNQQVFLKASAWDVDDGALPGTNIHWTSSLNGALGTGTVINLAASQLSEGTHQITVTATDSGGLMGSAAVDIVVSRTKPAVADLSLSVGCAVIPGNNAVYTVTVLNLGPSTATGVSLTNTLPGGVIFDSATTTQGSCGTTNGVVIGNLGSLLAGSNAVVTVVVTPTVSGTVTNTATVGGNEIDPWLANNTATTISTVNGPNAPFQITAFTVQSNNVLVTWIAPEGSTNVVQATNGGPGGNYSTNFLPISPLIVLGGNNPAAGASTNYLDLGGATNKPARYYRIAMGNVTNPPSGLNLLYDPGFEEELTAPNPNLDGVQGWATFEGARFLTTPLARTGTNVMYTPNGGGSYSVPGAYEVFAATNGETFVLSGWVYTPNLLVSNSNDYVILQIASFTGAPPNNYAGGTEIANVGVNVGEPAGGGGVPLPQGVWTYASVTGTVQNSGTLRVNSIGLYLLDINADSKADFYFDDISLTVIAPP